MKQRPPFYLIQTWSLGDATAEWLYCWKDDLSYITERLTQYVVDVKGPAETLNIRRNRG